MANVTLLANRYSIRSSIILPASIATSSGWNGDKPLAISSAFTNSRQSRISGRTVIEAVVLPAPLHPAIMYNVGPFIDNSEQIYNTAKLIKILYLQKKTSAAVSCLTACHKVSSTMLPSQPPQPRKSPRRCRTTKKSSYLNGRTPVHPPTINAPGKQALRACAPHRPWKAGAPNLRPAPPMESRRSEPAPRTALESRLSSLRPHHPLESLRPAPSLPP